jgi:hypothetical protein
MYNSQLSSYPAVLWHEYMMYLILQVSVLYV